MTTKHDLPFLCVEWPLDGLWGPKLGLIAWKVGTVHGLYYCSEQTYQIIAVINDIPNNGHLDDAFEWFEQSCKRDGRRLEITEFLNPSFAEHLIKKRGFKWLDDKKRTVVKDFCETKLLEG